MTENKVHPLFVDKPKRTTLHGDVVTYNGDESECIQAHTAQAGWTLPVVPALWRQL